MKTVIGPKSTFDRMWVESGAATPDFFFGARCGMLKTGAQTNDNLSAWLAWAKTEYAL